LLFLMPTKKTSPKKAVKTVNCPDDKVFFAVDGAIYRNYPELVSGLKRMDEGAFRFHVNEQKNDFACWIKDVFHDAKLAASLKQDLSRDAYLKKIAAKAK